MTVEDLQFPVLVFEDGDAFVMHDAGSFKTYAAHGINRKPPYRHALIIDSAGKTLYTAGVCVGAPIPRILRERFSPISVPLVEIEVLFSDEPVDYTLDDLKTSTIATIKRKIHVLDDGAKIGNGLLAIKRAQTVQELMVVADADTFESLDAEPAWPADISGEGISVFSRPITKKELEEYPQPYMPGIGTLITQIFLVVFLGFGLGCAPFVITVATGDQSDHSFMVAGLLFLITNITVWIVGILLLRRNQITQSHLREAAKPPSTVTVYRLTPTDIIQVKTKHYAFPGGYVLQLGEDRLAFLALDFRAFSRKHFDLIFSIDGHLLKKKAQGEKVEPSRTITYKEGQGFFPDDPIVMPGRLEEVEELLKM